MTKNSKAISLSRISFSFDSNFASSWDHCHSSSSQRQPPPPPPPATTNQPLEIPPTNKPRGRPPGSRNKPKSTSLPVAQPASLLVAQPTEPSVKLVKIDVAPGRDVIETILNVARQRHISLTVVNASGTIDSVTLRSSPHGGTTFMLHGPFTLLSLTGFYIYNNHYTLHLGATPPPPLYFGTKLSTYDGQVFSGLIDGRVVSGDDVSVMVSTFKNPEIYKHIPEGEVGDNNDKNNNNKNPSDE